MDRVWITTDAGEFWQRAGAWLQREPVLRSVLLTTLDRERRGGSGGTFALLSDGAAAAGAGEAATGGAGGATDGAAAGGASMGGAGGAAGGAATLGVAASPGMAASLGVAGEAGMAATAGVAGVAVWTPPFRVYVAAPPVEAERLALAMLDRCPAIDGVTGAADESAAFARAWAGRTGGTVAVSMHQRLFELHAVVPPRPVAGAARLAGPDDSDLLVEWTLAFERESNAAPGASVAERVVGQLVAEQRAWLWDDDGRACFVGVSRTVGGVARIAPVYTPPDRRRRGYASALVAAVSQAVLDAGAGRCALFTDLANPTANHVYAALGYRPVADVTAYTFSR
ncbi:GNAT family N-acetyltransferase [Jiangella alba]|uniref:Predicted acetyltransferase, GNAT family n=1 Tax=Jiangella alba TaxID=561176 RepID=A0A1H5P6K5_9ACTN|nr:GNAT family N-acetyltransferase [Jiangella alba]SEF08681.1 Predicted acetyltransferase, GNAT family [Jiangella alba]